MNDEWNCDLDCGGVIHLECFGFAQTGGKQTTQSKSGARARTSQGNEEASLPAAGFSIETEMFTSKGVGENSALIACDVARYLYRSNVTKASEDSQVPCMVSDPALAQPCIVIVSSDSTLLVCVPCKIDDECVPPENKSDRCGVWSWALTSRRCGVYLPNPR
jgi:hypothetical protein